MKEHTVEVAAGISGAASKTTYVGAVGGFFGYLASVDVIAWLGIFIAVAGFAVNLYYKRKENKRAEELHQIKMQQARGHCNAE
ncbi:hypothetical protein AhaeINNSZ174_07570 [Acinetobacter haemolyticus]|uniref:holin n=1 Tax=Acinetobacter haemolyticus TaxID=29430 RepID=UPI001331DEE2|nr:holin [Acinetobacter haemolyticus]QHI29332.1 hypothetical protein AhaeINNSZ174_07570 [Acinetobacter haemolyticus]